MGTTWHETGTSAQTVQGSGQPADFAATKHLGGRLVAGQQRQRHRGGHAREVHAHVGAGNHAVRRGGAAERLRRRDRPVRCNREEASKGARRQRQAAGTQCKRPAPPAQQ